MSELELKFQVPRTSLAAVRRALSAGKTQRLHLQARYHDTADGLLAAHSLALRLRQEGRAWMQTLKGSTGHLAQREEHDVALGAVGRGGPSLDVQRHHDSAIGQALLRLLQEHPEAELQQVYATDVWRTHRVLSRSGARIELALDEGCIIAGNAKHPLCELEFELKSGPPAALFELAQAWSERHGLWLDSVSKAQRGQLLARGLAFAEPVKAGTPTIDRKTGAAHTLAQIVNGCLAQVLPNASEVAAGCPTPEHVHQLRVGLRRLRTAWRELTELAPMEWPAADAQAVDTAFAALGAARDDQVVGGHITARLQAAGAPWPQWPAAADAPALPAATVQDAAFQRALIGLLAYTHDALHQPDDTGAPHALIAKRLQHLHGQLTKAAKRFEALPVAEQHRVRKRLKRLRYLAEFAAPLYRRPDVDKYLRALRPAQDALGQHNDEAVAEAAYRRVTAEEPRAWFAVGWLLGQQAESARQCAQALRQVADAPPFWRQRGKKRRAD
ncbi:MAG TPA: CHAD domain-containing protein [Ideonella sp.]|uniref:CYTH and CHAD domain-containing protein n=1 Tax=Ideonella sp. TaxID=1929293 RepID=UPI002E372982|nr:CHAD domain-containing protein [Ideonella sp.]HEX5682713.1 CHAD domain-containing protein [Ideonella sp.]